MTAHRVTPGIKSPDVIYIRPTSKRQIIKFHIALNSGGELIFMKAKHVRLK
jgi:hypothetical protein